MTRKTSLLLALLLAGCSAKGSGGSERPGPVSTSDAGSAGVVAAGGDAGSSSGSAGSSAAAASSSGDAGTAGDAGTSGSDSAGSAGTGDAGASSGGAGTSGDAGASGTGAGTSGDAGASGTGAGPDPSKLLTALGADEQTAMCQEISDYLNSPDVLDKQHEMDCRTAGFYSTVGGMPSDQATARMMCKMTHDLCLASEGPSSVMNCGMVGSSCTATVGDLLACWHTTSTQLTLALATLPSCDTLTLADLQMTMRPSPPPSAECQSFDQKCPGAMMAMLGR